MFKKKSTKILLGILTVLVLVLAGFEFKSVVESNEKNNSSVPVTKMIGPYKVNTNQTDFQKKVGQELEEALKTKQGVPITRAVSKYFVSDFFTLRNRTDKNDVGGMGFVLLDAQAQFKANAIASYYRDLVNFKDSYGAENLPLVTDVSVGAAKRVANSEVSVNESSTLKIESVYDIPVSWQYEKNDVLAKIDIVDKAVLRFVRASDNNWYIYQINEAK